MENCARYANDKMIDSDRLFFRIFVSFILCSFICIDGKNGKDQKRLKKKPKKKKRKGNCGYERIWRIGRQSEANRYSQQIRSTSANYYSDLSRFLTPVSRE